MRAHPKGREAVLVSELDLHQSHVHLLLLSGQTLLLRQPEGGLRRAREPPAKKQAITRCPSNAPPPEVSRDQHRAETCLLGLPPPCSSLGSCWGQKWCFCPRPPEEPAGAWEAEEDPGMCLPLPLPLPLSSHSDGRESDSVNLL